eukprot:NODE_413_length_7912_cov_0.917061.p6 type:complete len:213 gc:universal NODE_413_length_7912_cov_0.917061:1004-1642(+)
MICVLIHLNQLSPAVIQQILIYINSLIAIEMDVKVIVCFAGDIEVTDAKSFSQLENFIRNLRPPKNRASPLDAAISLALLQLRNHTGDRKLVIINAIPDNDAQYISMMNCIFSSQKLNVSIDSIVLTPSIYLQQAAFITNGLYLEVEELEILQKLLECIPFKSSRRLRMTKVDFRATCFCHRKTIDIGYVCSVCLSIFCEQCKECKTCKTLF